MSENKAEQSSGSGKKILLIVIIVLVIAGGCFGGYMFFKDKFTSSKPKKPNVVNYNQNQPAQNGAYPVQNIVSSKTYSLDEFLVNLSDEDGKRFLKAKIYLGYEEKKLDKELETKKPILRDAIIATLRCKKAADINPKSIDKIKSEIVSKINPMLEDGQVQSVYFDDLLVQ
ncbi:flagellar basal body-associated FliL family protein [Clostridium oceanicum]|uniref:Flagellar protein FliL n=1 Tax=Clostridium oceanicum TaxID=1543 RepID=A0ABN1JTA0_9CLOT